MRRTSSVIALFLTLALPAALSAAEPAPEKRPEEFYIANSAVSTFMTVRSQIELYKIQHADTPPAFDELKEWKALRQPTTSGSRTLGPYMQRAPINAFTGSSTIAAPGQATAKDGWVYKSDGNNYTLKLIMPVEYVKVIGPPPKKLAEFIEVVEGAVDRDKIKSQAPRRHSEAQLDIVRSQIELYKIQHADAVPTFDQIQDWKALIQKTDYKGVNPAGKFGPYIQDAPINKFTGATRIVAAGNATRDDGWTYKAAGNKVDIRIVLPDMETANRLGFDPGDYEIAKR